MSHDHDHDDEHHHHHGEFSDLDDTALRVRTLESLLTEKGLIEQESLDLLIDKYENKVGPQIGAKIIAKAWCDEGFKARLLEDGTKAVAELGYGGRAGEHLLVKENTATVHNMVVCTLCSCYPWTVLGLPPIWYKSAPYRSRAVSEPRKVLSEFGVTLPEDKEIRVWDSTSEMRYLIMPERPTGTDHLSEAELEKLVNRNSMIGTSLVSYEGDIA